MSVAPGRRRLSWSQRILHRTPARVLKHAQTPNLTLWYGKLVSCHSIFKSMKCHRILAVILDNSKFNSEEESMSLAGRSITEHHIDPDLDQLHALIDTAIAVRSNLDHHNNGHGHGHAEPSLSNEHAEEHGHGHGHGRYDGVVLIGAEKTNLEVFVACCLCYMGCTHTAKEAFDRYVCVRGRTWLWPWTKKTIKSSPTQNSLMWQFNIATHSQQSRMLSNLQDDVVLKSVVFSKMPCLNGEGCRLALLILQNYRIVYSTFQHNPMSIHHEEHTDITRLINKHLKNGAVTLKAYHMPEKTSSSHPRVLLCQLEFYSGAALAHPKHELVFSRPCIDLVYDPRFFDELFTIKLSFALPSEEVSTEADKDKDESSRSLSEEADAHQHDPLQQRDYEQELQDMVMARQLQNSYDLEFMPLRSQRQRHRIRNRVGNFDWALLNPEMAALGLPFGESVSRHNGSDEALSRPSDSSVNADASSSALDQDASIANDEAYARQLQAQFDAQQFPYEGVIRASPATYPFAEDAISSALLSLRLMDYGASAHQLSLLPSFKCTPDSSLLQDQCSICRHKFRRDQILRTIPCFHTFHRDCVDTWLIRRATCPICQTSIDVHEPVLEPAPPSFE